MLVPRYHDCHSTTRSDRQWCSKRTHIHAGCMLWVGQRAYMRQPTIISPHRNESFPKVVAQDLFPHQIWANLKVVTNVPESISWERIGMRIRLRIMIPVRDFVLNQWSTGTTPEEVHKSATIGRYGIPIFWFRWRDPEERILYRCKPTSKSPYSESFSCLGVILCRGKRQLS